MTGAKASDILGAGAIVVRLAGLDASMGNVRGQVTNTIRAQLFNWAGRVGDGIGDAMDEFDETRQAEKVEKAKAKEAAEKSAAEKVATKPVEAVAAP